MKLTEQELQSAVWKKLEAHITSRIESARCQNDGELDAIATARLRGRIGAWKELLALGQPGPAQAEVDG